MKQKLTDYIADFFVAKGITQVFCVVGGGAMHLNDSFGHRDDMTVLYQHHEQAAAMAAEGYARVAGKPAICCVTSGPGATNAITGVVGAYQDSIPMIVLSGQAKSTLCLHTSKVPLRTIGGQEVDIVPAVQQGMVKYASIVLEPRMIRQEMEHAYHEAVTGRPGPVWLDLPLDVQGSYIETEELMGAQDAARGVKPAIHADVLQEIVRRFRAAKRPVLYAGNGIRLSGGMEALRTLLKKWQIPVVTCWDSIDLIATDDPCYVGRGGNMGDRAGNFAVQNSDFLIAIGARLSIYQVGWHYDTWARAAYKVICDIDPYELAKPILRADLPVCADARDLLCGLLRAEDIEGPADARQAKAAWRQQCLVWREKYPVVQPCQYAEQGLTNVYAFIDTLSRRLPEHALTVVTNGSASVVGSQTYYIKDGDRFLMNCGLSSMGYGLPASIGACIGAEKKVTICIEGDGSIMMNLQELQTVVTNQLHIKIFVINNQGYHQIRQTQNNVFHNGLVGVGPESGDLGFPSFEKLAAAFGLPYVAIHDNAEIANGVDEAIQCKGPVLVEVFVSTTQKFEPKSATKKLPDGSLFSPPLEDLAPFLPREELAANMYIPLIEENGKKG